MIHGAKSTLGLRDLIVSNHIRKAVQKETNRNYYLTSSHTYKSNINVYLISNYTVDRNYNNSASANRMLTFLSWSPCCQETNRCYLSILKWSCDSEDFYLVIRRLDCLSRYQVRLFVPTRQSKYLLSINILVERSWFDIEPNQRQHVHRVNIARVRNLERSVTPKNISTFTNKITTVSYSVSTGKYIFC